MYNIIRKVSIITANPHYYHTHNLPRFVLDNRDTIVNLPRKFDTPASWTRTDIVGWKYKASRSVTVSGSMLSRHQTYIISWSNLDHQSIAGYTRITLFIAILLLVRILIRLITRLFLLQWYWTGPLAYPQLRGISYDYLRFQSGAPNLY